VSRRTNRQYRIWSGSARKNLEKTEPMKQISVGIIGSGFIAELHMHAYRRVFGLDATVRAVVSRGDRVVEFAKRFGIPQTYRDYRELLPGATQSFFRSPSA
jgi:ornithine cyclodeaminase/alanine dehydrogenase-like protein (mu-crystallin family)